MTKLEKILIELQVEEETQKRLLHWANKYQKKAPGFFTPFKSKTDFAITVSSPITVPLMLGTMAGVIAVGSALAAITCVGSLLFGTLASPFSPNKSSFSLNISLISGVASLGLAAAAIGVLLAAVIALPANLLAIGTRSGASIAKIIEPAVCDKKDNTDFAAAI